MHDAELRLKTVAEVAKILNVHPTSLYKKIKDGQIPVFKFGSKILMDIDVVLEAMRIK